MCFEAGRDRVLAIRRPLGSPPVERCLACEADGEQGQFGEATPNFIGALCRGPILRNCFSSRTKLPNYTRFRALPDERLATELSLLAIGLASEAALHGSDRVGLDRRPWETDRSTSMDSDYATLSRLTTFLRTQAGVADKLAITRAYAPAQELAGAIRVGDDCAAIPDNDGFLLFAGEGMLESFVETDPWFAGYSAVMVNLSDIAAMGGRPLAIVDILWTPELEKGATIWEGITAASQAYGVPVVGGHTTVTQSEIPFWRLQSWAEPSSLLPASMRGRETNS